QAAGVVDEEALHHRRHRRERLEKCRGPDASRVPGARHLVVEAFEVEAGPPRRDRDAQPAGGGWIRHAVVHVDLLLTLNRITRRPTAPGRGQLDAHRRGGIASRRPRKEGAHEGLAVYCPCAERPRTRANGWPRPREK